MGHETWALGKHWGETCPLPSQRCRRAIRSRGLRGLGLSVLHRARCPHHLPLSVVLHHLFGGQNFMRNSTMFCWRLRHQGLDGKSYLRTRLKVLRLRQWHAEISFKTNRARPQQSYDTSKECVLWWGGAYSQFHLASPDLCPYTQSPLSSISHRHVSWIIFPEESFD